MVTPLYNFRMNATLKAKLLAIAARDDRTLSYLIDKILTEYVRQYEQQPKVKK